MFGVRLYTRDGSDGVNGANDWQFYGFLVPGNSYLLSSKLYSVDYLDSAADHPLPPLANESFQPPWEVFTLPHVFLEDSWSSW
jgi:hypothetical protein